MTLPSAGVPLSINDIHIEVTGTSGTTASLNDADIRGLIGKADQAQNAISEYYGASFIQTLNTTYTPNAGYEGLTSTNVSSSDLSNVQSSAYSTFVTLGYDNNVNTGKIFKNTSLESALSGRTILSVTTCSIRLRQKVGAYRDSVDNIRGITNYRFYTGSPGSWTQLTGGVNPTTTCNSPNICGPCGEQVFDYDVTKPDVMTSGWTVNSSNVAQTSPIGAVFGSTTDRDNWLKAGAPMGFTESQPQFGAADNELSWYQLTVNLTYQ